MGAFTAALPIIIRLAQNGTLMQVVAAAFQLIKLIEPVLADPAKAEQLEAALAGFKLLAPAQPDNPAMARVAR